MKIFKFTAFAILLVLVWLSFLLGFKNTCNDPKVLDYGQRQLCWYKKIKVEMDKRGIKSALKLLGVLYRKYSSFAGSCHDVTHLIGKQAYLEYKEGKNFNFPEETSWCGYGFYHGFIETMLSGSRGYSEARNFCESVNKNAVGNIVAPIAIYSCYHGIGHATFDNHDPKIVSDAEVMIKPAIAKCEDVTVGLEFEKTKQCVTGVFNSLANAYGTGSYGLKMSDLDPVDICRIQDAKYRKYCFIEVSMAWINIKMGNYDFKFTDGARFVENIGDAEGEKGAINALASEYGHLHQNFLSDTELINNCRSVKTDLFESCMYGNLLAILNWGTPGVEYKRAIAFCGSDKLSDQEKNSCYTYIFKNIPTHYSNNKMALICPTAPKKYRALCVNHGQP